MIPHMASYRVLIALRTWLLLRSTQPSLFTCLPRAIASDPAGTSSVIDEPAAT